MDKDLKLGLLLSVAIICLLHIGGSGMGSGGGGAECDVGALTRELDELEKTAAAASASAAQRAAKASAATVSGGSRPQVRTCGARTPASVFPQNAKSGKLRVQEIGALLQDEGRHEGAVFGPHASEHAADLLQTWTMCQQLHVGAEHEVAAAYTKLAASKEFTGKLRVRTADSPHGDHSNLDLLWVNLDPEGEFPFHTAVCVSSPPPPFVFLCVLFASAVLPPPSVARRCIHTWANTQMGIIRHWVQKVRLSTPIVITDVASKEKQAQLMARVMAQLTREVRLVSLIRVYFVFVFLSLD